MSRLAKVVLVAIVLFLNISPIVAEDLDKILERKSTFSQFFTNFDEVRLSIARNIEKSEGQVYVFDLDETILSNSFGESWLTPKFDLPLYEEQWERTEQPMMAKSNPAYISYGSMVELVVSLKQAGKTVCFVTNRKPESEAATIDTLTSVFGTQVWDCLLFKCEKVEGALSNKQSNFNKVCQLFSVSLEEIIFVGDDKNDFPDYRDIQSFGVKFFLMPNDMYGVQCKEDCSKQLELSSKH